MMNRTTGGYILMILLCGSALWGILHVGSTLKAPPDLSGQWAVVETGKPDRQAVIQQSGVFVVLTVEHEKPQRIDLNDMQFTEHLSKSDRGTELRIDSYRLRRERKDASK